MCCAQSVANERMVFHGARSSVLSQICKTGFDKRLAGSENGAVSANTANIDNVCSTTVLQICKSVCVSQVLLYILSYCTVAVELYHIDSSAAMVPPLSIDIRSIVLIIS